MDFPTIFPLKMPSVIKRDRSPYFFCSFRSADGRWLKKSTKQTDRTKAMRVCMEWDKAAEKARGGNLTTVQARKILAEMVVISSGESLCDFSVEAWISQWLSSKEGSAAASTMLRYRQVMRDFLASMEARAKNALAGVSAGDIIRFRDALRKEGRAVSSVNVTVKKILSAPFESARKLGYIPSNPVAGVDNLKNRDESRAAGRDSFTQEEVVSLVTAAGEESDWYGAIILAATTGLRLGDVANLTWASIDQETKLIRVETQKTDAIVTLPVHPDFSEWLDTRTQGIGKAPVFPLLSSRYTGGRRGLSADFRKIMKKAGVVSSAVMRKGQGRTTFKKSFHSLRHTFISGLANAGIAADIRQKLAGHVDAKVHAGYTHHDIENIRAAVEKLPRLKPQNENPEAGKTKRKARAGSKS